MSAAFQINNETLGFTVVIEDDDRVAYAYLLQGQMIVSDVWLYNCGVPPSKPEWQDPSKMPFANPITHSTNLRVLPIVEPSDVRVEWNAHNGMLTNVDLFISGTLYARLVPGEKPGWCRNATKSGPLAKVLEA